MNRKIIGVTVGTPTSPNKMKDEIKPVQTVNGQAPDENGNVDIEAGGGGNAVEYIEQTLTEEQRAQVMANLGLKKEQWELTYEDGTTETKAVYVG